MDFQKQFLVRLSTLGRHEALADKTSVASVSQADALELGSRGFNTTGFSNMQGQTRGKLDQYCGMERAFYFISLCIM